MTTLGRAHRPGGGLRPPDPRYTAGLRRVLLLYPASGVVAVLALAAVMWPRLPEVMVTHWGAGGADGTLPKAWAVGVAVATSLGGLIWALLDLGGRRSTKQACEAAVIGGLCAWLGAFALVASIWLADAGMLVAWLMLVPTILTGVVMWGATGRRPAS